MRLTKTLQTLIERAERNGYAVKRVREGNIMGSAGTLGGFREWVRNTPLIEQWEVSVERDVDNGMAFEHVTVKHYGTQIAHIVIHKEIDIATLQSYYGESNSDRDALNGLCDYYGIGASFSYRPSVDEFKMEGVTA